MQIIVNGQLTGYDRQGKSARVIVMLHGWGADRKSMAGLATSLAKDFSIITVDIPGFGESPRPGTIWGLSEYAQWLMDFTEKLGLNPLYALLGHSNGGAIAIKATSLGFAPTKLVLIGASGVRNREKGKKLFLKSVAKTGKVATSVLPSRLKNKVRSKWYKTIGSELYDVAGMEEFFKKVTSEDLLVDSAMISTPSLLVYGADDRATPPAYGRMYHDTIENSELCIVDDAGHYVFLDKPEQTTSLIQKFLNR